MKGRLDHRVDELEKAKQAENRGKGTLIVWPESVAIKPTDAEVKAAEEAFEVEHGYPPAFTLRVAYDGNDGGKQ